MNYITQLQNENRELAAKVNSLENGLRAVKTYVNSHKFHCGSPLDNYVSCADITLRVNEILSK